MMITKDQDDSKIRFYASINSKREHSPQANPEDFFHMAKSLPPGREDFAKIRPRAKNVDKNPTPHPRGIFFLPF